MPLNVPNIVFKTRVRDESIGGDNPFRWQDGCLARLHQPVPVLIFLVLKPNMMN